MLPKLEPNFRRKKPAWTFSEAPTSWTLIPRKATKNEKEKLDESNTSLSGSMVFEPRKPKTEGGVPPPRPVVPRGSMIQENVTRLASIETRSLGLQTMSPTVTRSVKTQSTSFTTDKGLIAAVALHPAGLQDGGAKTPVLHQSDHRTGS